MGLLPGNLEYKNSRHSMVVWARYCSTGIAIKYGLLLYRIRVTTPVNLMQLLHVQLWEGESSNLMYEKL